MLDTTEAYGLSFLFPAGDEAVGASLKRYGEFARPELDLLLEYASAPSATLIDVGANIGAIALPFAKARPAWKVVAIEAHRGLCNLLATNTFNNRLYNVEPFHAAAGPEMRFVDFPAPPLSHAANYGTLSLTRIGRQTEPIRMFPLDHLAPRTTALVKIDVEGFEPEVLKGATGLLAAKRAIWLAEAGGKTQEANQSVVQTFLDAGYQVFWFFAPFATPSSERGNPEKCELGDANVLALPPGIENRWGLTPITSADAPRPTRLEAYSYLARYGY
jgi:FkbM family methyltransferase